MVVDGCPCNVGDNSMTFLLRVVTRRRFPVSYCANLNQMFFAAMFLKSNLPAAVLAVLFFTTTTLAAQSRPLSFFEYLTPREGVALTLSTDVSALIANKNSGDYQPAKLTTADGKTFELQVKSRGKFRRKIAEIPPLKLKIKKKALATEGLDTLNELKLVLPCTLDENGNTLVIREYLAYRMFEHLTPNSVRARLIDLDLINTGTGHQPRYTVKAILLEDEEETAARLGGVLLDSYGMTTDSLETRQAALTAMFQYMIGNTDWNISEQRNVRFLQTTGGEILMIPFDFDFAGFVNAPYATPTSDTGLKNVRERYLMPDQLDSPALQTAFRKMQDAREVFRQICRSSVVAPDEAAKLVEYLDSFYEKKGKNEKGDFR